MSDALSIDLWADVVCHEAAAYAPGITGVPAFLVDQRVPVHGAQGADEINGALRQAWASRVP